MKDESRRWLPLSRWFAFHCRDCGSSTGLRSRSRTFGERYLLPIFLMQPVRCAECFRRDYRFIFTSTQQRQSGKLKRMPPPRRTNSNVA